MVESILKTVYLGDRYCKSEKYDAQKGIYQVQMNCISRIRSSDGEWNFYNDENIDDGIISFEGVSDIERSSELEINDEIFSIEILASEESYYIFHLIGSYVNDEGVTSEVSVRIEAKEVCLINPMYPDKKIYY